MNATRSLVQIAAVAGVVLISSAYTRAEPTCQIVTVALDRGIELSRPMRDAIARYDPTFTVWADDDYLPLIRQFYRYTEFQAPFAVIGDFNGDSVTDVVLDGRTRRFPVVIALLSTAERRYRVSEVVRAAGTLEPAEELYESVKVSGSSDDGCFCVGALTGGEWNPSSCPSRLCAAAWLRDRVV